MTDFSMPVEARFALAHVSNNCSDEVSALVEAVFTRYFKTIMTEGIVEK